MIISLVAAIAENRVIGNSNTIPWDLPADRKRFRDLTMGHPIIMGRKTFESIGHHLPGRTNIIVTRQTGYHAEDCLIANDLPTALQMAGNVDETFICGGGDIYRQALPLAQRIYLTIIHRNYPGDTVFPEIPSIFKEVAREDIIDDPPFTFLTLTR